MKFRILPLLPLMLAGAILLQGCDWIAEKAGIDKVDASLGSVGANLVITPDGASSNSGTVNVSDKDLPNVFDVESITINQSDVTYTAVAGKTGGVEASGTVDVFIVVDQAPAFGARVTITNDQVSGIAPSTIDVGAYNKTTFASCLERFSSNQRPALRAGYENLTQAQIGDIVDDAIVSGSFSASMVVCTNGDLAGLLTFTELTFNLDF